MAPLPEALSSPPPSVSNVLVTFPRPHVLLITLDRPDQLNAIPTAQHAELEALYRWYDGEPHLRAAVLTGSGRAFCAGADLREWDARNNAAAAAAAASSSGGEGKGGSNAQAQTPAGFGGLSNRPGKKPVIAAVNGACLGGGMEMALNCDLVVAAAGAARFGLPEVKIGVVALAGALPRVVRTLGRQRAAEMALLGRTYTAAQMLAWGVVNFVADDADVVAEALKVAEELAANSPDAVIVSREGLRLGWEAVGPELGTEIVAKGMYGRIDAGENMKEGVRSFVERRKPRWVESKL